MSLLNRSRPAFPGVERPSPNTIKSLQDHLFKLADSLKKLDDIFNAVMRSYSNSNSKENIKRKNSKIAGIQRIMDNLRRNIDNTVEKINVLTNEVQNKVNQIIEMNTTRRVQRKNRRLTRKN